MIYIYMIYIYMIYIYDIYHQYLQIDHHSCFFVKPNKTASSHRHAASSDLRFIIFIVLLHRYGIRIAGADFTSWREARPDRRSYGKLMGSYMASS